MEQGTIWLSCESCACAYYRCFVSHIFVISKIGNAHSLISWSFRALQQHFMKCTLTSTQFSRDIQTYLQNQLHGKLHTFFVMLSHSNYWYIAFWMACENEGALFLFCIASDSSSHQQSHELLVGWSHRNCLLSLNNTSPEVFSNIILI